MSIQAYKIKGLGYKLKYGEIPPIFNVKTSDELNETIDCLGIKMDYYKLRDKNDSNKETPCMCIITDGMNGEFTFCGYILQANFIENTHGEEFWSKSFRDDKYIHEYASENIEKAFGIKGTPQIIELEIYQ